MLRAKSKMVKAVCSAASIILTVTTALSLIGTADEFYLSRDDDLFLLAALLSIPSTLTLMTAVYLLMRGGRQSGLAAGIIGSILGLAAIAYQSRILTNAGGYAIFGAPLIACVIASAVSVKSPS